MIINTRYNTEPCVLHNPFKGDKYTSPFWDYASLYSGKVVCSIPDNLTIVTYNNKKGGCLESQLTKIGLPYICLGRGLKWNTNRNKTRLFIENFDMFETDYILAMDCYDVLVINDLKDILDKFLARDLGVLFNATGNSYPRYLHRGRDLFAEIEAEMCPHPPFQFFNSGVYIGHKEAIRDVFEESWASPKEHADRCPTSDQWILRPVYHSREDVEIDWKCELFQVAYLNDKMKPRVSPSDVKYDINEYLAPKVKVL
tara:strand:+ start:1986 stop:2753 length:768 start_codon:yes stop_codon:yes gene_type:complete